MRAVSQASVSSLQKRRHRQRTAGGQEAIWDEPFSIVTCFPNNNSTQTAAKLFAQRDQDADHESQCGHADAWLVRWVLVLYTRWYAHAYIPTHPCLGLFVAVVSRHDERNDPRNTVILRRLDETLHKRWRGPGAQIGESRSRMRLTPGFTQVANLGYGWKPPLGGLGRFKRPNENNYLLIRVLCANSRGGGVDPPREYAIIIPNDVERMHPRRCLTARRMHPHSETGIPRGSHLAPFAQPRRGSVAPCARSWASNSLSLG